MKERLKQFHNPDSRKTKHLFEEFFGVDITENWQWNNVLPKDARTQLNKWISIRGDAVHRVEVDANQPHVIRKDELIRGNKNGEIVLVEYSDFECPFCKRFHGTMQQVMDEYGEDGKVAWVYRQFPLEQLHPVKAVSESVASECVAEIGGNDAFWKFADRLYELTPSNNQTDIYNVIPQIVREIGIDLDGFNECWESDRYASHIESDIQNAGMAHLKYLYGTEVASYLYPVLRSKECKIGTKNTLQDGMSVL